MKLFRRQSAVPNRGTTLLELLIYLAIIAVVLVAATSFSFEFAVTRAKATALQETDRNVRLALARMAYEVRGASGINTGDSVFGANPGRLSLASDTAANDPTVFSVTDGRLYVQQGSGPNLPLTSTKVNIADLTIDDLSTPGKTRGVSIRLQADFLSDLQIYAASFVMETSAQVKKWDGFSN